MTHWSPDEKLILSFALRHLADLVEQTCDCPTCAQLTGTVLDIASQAIASATSLFDAARKASPDESVEQLRYARDRAEELVRRLKAILQSAQRAATMEQMRRVR